MISLLKCFSPPKKMEESFSIKEQVPIKVQLAENLLANTFCQEKLIELKQLVSCTSSDYQALYIALVKKIAAFFQIFPVVTNNVPSMNEQLLHTALARTVSALKIRRGYMLPIGTETETCYSEQDFWTYAIFSAALVKDVWQIPFYFNVIITDNKGHELESWQPFTQSLLKPHQYYQFTVKNIAVTANPLSLNLLLAKELLPLKGLVGLLQKPNVLQAWCEYLSGYQNHSNCLYQIISQAENSGSSKNLVSTSVVQPSIIKDSTTEDKFIYDVENKNECEITGMANMANSSQEKQSSLKQEDMLFNITSSFVAWLILELQFPDHSTNPFIFRIKDGYLFQFEAGFAKFFEEEPQVKQALMNDKTKKSYDNKTLHSQLLNTLIKQELVLINPNTNDYIHQFYRGKWELRNVIKGWIFPTDKLVPVDIPIDNDLQIDPMFS